MASGFKKWRNPQNDLVTELDMALERFIVGELRTSFPDAAILSEEAENDPIGRGRQLTFIVDPLDGTHVLIAGENEWAISIAAVLNGIALVGVLYFPVIERRIWAVRCQGCYLNGRRVELPLGPHAGPYRIAVSPRQLGMSCLTNGLKALNGEAVLISAVTPKVAAIMDGRVEAAAFLKQEGKHVALWDYAAAMLILQEAGGRMTSLTGRPLPYDTSSIFHQDGWIASDGSFHEKILSVFGRLP